MPSVEEYVDLHYGGDSSRVNFVRIDYSKVRSVSQLISWAIKNFGIESERETEAIAGEPFVELLFRYLGERGQDFIVLESFPRHMSPDVREVLEGDHGWKGALGFHLHRDYLSQIAFLQDPDTKGKQPRTSSGTPTRSRDDSKRLF